MGKIAEVSDAIEYLNSNDMPLIFLNENSIIDKGKIIDHDVIVSTSRFDVVTKIGVLKNKLRTNPKNPISWVDLSYYYTLLGQKDKAIYSINVALNLAPNNRFILRSASRLYIHLDKPDIAHLILIKSDAIRTDPWVISAEIAVAHAAKTNSKNLKRAKEIIGRKDIDPWHISELSSAIATYELMHGSHKKAKKIFEQSLINPTENSIAQVGWAHRRDSIIKLPENTLKVPNTFEARAWHHYKNEDWKKTIKEAMNWLEDQPFSSRPAVLGSYVSLLALGDNKKSIEFCVEGLRCNPTNVYLLNNAAVAYSYLGNTGAAIKYIDRLDYNKLTDDQKIMCLATKGLISYKSGDKNNGKNMYEKAIKLAIKTNKLYSMFSAALHFAYEEAVHNPIFAKTLLKEKINTKQIIIEPVLIPFLERINKRVKFIDDINEILPDKTLK